MLAGFNKFGFNESSRFNESVLNLIYFLLYKNFGFIKFPGLTNNWHGLDWFLKSGRHCMFIFTLSIIRGLHCMWTHTISPPSLLQTGAISTSAVDNNIYACFLYRGTYRVGWKHLDFLLTEKFFNGLWPQRSLILNMQSLAFEPLFRHLTYLPLKWPWSDLKWPLGHSGVLMWPLGHSGMPNEPLKVQWI